MSMENENIQLEIDQFVELKKKELNLNSDDLVKLEICSQSIYHWVQYCEYHYFTLIGASTEEDLKRDRVWQIRRAGENVKLRFVYEANIAACLQSLHALLDSFPYLLNLFCSMDSNSESAKIKWSSEFIKKYESYSFYSHLKNFMCDATFNQVKGYANRIKHKHLVRVANKGKHLEFESFFYKQPVEKQAGVFAYEDKELVNRDAIKFLEECHNYLMPKFFNLCDAVLDSKRQQLKNSL